MKTTVFFYFSTIIPINRLINTVQNTFVDNRVIAMDGTIGYYLHTKSPTANVASYCNDSSCQGSVIFPDDDGRSISLCQQDDNTIVNPSSNIYTYDLMLSTTEGCYPIVGTVDYSIYQFSNAMDFNVSKVGLDVKIKSGNFFFNGPTIIKPLSVMSVGATTASQRQDALRNICHIIQDGVSAGYSHCNYRDCSWLGGDYVQQVSACSAKEQQRKVSYTLCGGSNNTCI